MRVLIAALICALLTVPAAAAVKATFIGPGTYATKDGCAKLEALAAGGDRNAGTAPETLTQDGFTSWEGTCTFESFTEKEKDRMWSAKLNCAEAASEGPESDIFEKMPDGTLKVTVMDNAVTFVRCDREKGK